MSDSLPVEPEDRGGQVDLREVGRVLWRRRFVIAGVLALSLALAAGYVVLAEREYRSTVTLEIERRAPEVLEFTDVVGQDPAGYHDFYQTQYRILQSDRVLNLAIDIAELPQHPAYLERKPSPLGRLVLEIKSALGAKQGAVDPQERARVFLKERLAVTPVRNSHLVRVSIVDADPRLSQELATAVGDAYRRFQFDSRRQLTGEASAFLATDVHRVQDEIDTLERTLQELANERDTLPARVGDTPIAEQSLASLNAALTAAMAHLSEAEARDLAVRDAPTEAIDEVSRSPLIVHLRQEVAALEQERARLAERFRADWPALRAVEDQLSEVQSQLEATETDLAARVRASAATEHSRAKQTVTALRRRHDQQMKEVRTARRDAVELEALRSEIDTKREVLQQLSARQSETAASHRLQETGTSNIRVVDPATTPRKPVKPRIPVALAMAVMIGLGCGVGAALVVEQLDRTVRTPEDVARISGVPMLAEIPQGGEVTWLAPKPDRPVPTELTLDLASHAAPRSPYAEAFRNLRTSLLLSSADEAPRHLVITSSSPGEGKSTNCQNLAIVLTQLGRRVLMIDADLRRPRLHESLGMDRGAGLSTYLSGNSELEPLIQATEIPGLFGITAGPAPPNPSELLGSQRMGQALEWLVGEGEFDHVVIDSPPILAVSDSIVLSALCQATIVVVRSGAATTDRLRTSFERLKQARGRVIGTVLNAVPASEGYGYYYYRGYSDAREPKGSVGSQRRRAKIRDAS